jgi:hypothetical protein
MLDSTMLNGKQKLMFFSRIVKDKSSFGNIQTVRLLRLLSKRLLTSLAGTECPPLETRSSIRT